MWSIGLESCMADRDWTPEELERVEERDQLAMKQFRGPPLTEAEQARLEELNGWLDSLYPPTPSLPPEVRKIIDDVLGPDRG